MTGLDTRTNNRDLNTGGDNTKGSNKQKTINEQPRSLTCQDELKNKLYKNTRKLKVLGHTTQDDDKKKNTVPPNF